MKLEHLQAMRIKIRGELSMWYKNLEMSKGLRKKYDEEGALDYEYYHHNQVNWCKAEIKKLVAIQCDIKADIKKELSWQRAARKMELYKASAMASVGEVF